MAERKQYAARLFIRRSIDARLDHEIVEFNDNAQSKEEVLAILDKAIELAKTEEANQK